MKDQIVAVDQAANIGIQFQGKRPSGPAFIIWSIPTKRTQADAAGKAGDADGGRHARQHVKKLGGHRAVDLHFFDGCWTSTGPVTFTLPATGTSWIQVYQLLSF